MAAIYSDLNLTFKKHPGTGDVLKKLNVEAVKASLRNVILGNAFDVPFDPNFGGAIRGLLFELITAGTIASVKRNIILKVSEYEPRVTIQDISITEGQNSVNIEILFYVIGNPTIQNINLVLERVR